MTDYDIRKRLGEYFSDKLPAFYRKVEEWGIDADRYSWPCLPYVGASFDSGPRVLIVGKAPGAWSDGSEEELVGDHYGTLRECLDRSAEASHLLNLSNLCVTRRVLPHYAGEKTLYPLYSPFWRRAYVLTARILRRDPSFEVPRERELARECFSQLAWTNLFKVGLNRGNPDEKMTTFLLDNFDTLKDEFEIIQPQFVFFSTGWNYDWFLAKALKASFDQVCDFAAIVRCRFPDCVRFPLRTEHFQVVSNTELSEISRMACAIS